MASQAILGETTEIGLGLTRFRPLCQRNHQAGQCQGGHRKTGGDAFVAETGTVERRERGDLLGGTGNTLKVAALIPQIITLKGEIGSITQLETSWWWGADEVPHHQRFRYSAGFS